MELYEAMSTLRAVRRLRPDPIPEAVLQRVLTAATWAPTGGNRQPWRIVAVKDPAKKQVLEDLYRPYWDALHRQLSQTHGVDAGARTRNVGARDRRRHVPRDAHARGPGDRGVLLQPGDDDDHRQGPAAAVGRRRRIGVSRRSEPAARVPQRGARLRADDPALSRRAEGTRTAASCRTAGTRARTCRSATRSAAVTVRSPASRPRRWCSSTGSATPDQRPVQRKAE